MSTLVVQAHPLHECLNAAMLDAVVSRAASAGKQTSIARIGQGDTLTPELFDGITELVVVYPTWWGSLPAMLLAELNQIIGPWVDGDKPAATSPLRTVEHLTAVTSHGSSRFINRLQGEPGLQLWKRTVLPLCAPGAGFEWKSLYKLDRATEAERLAFLQHVAS